MKHLPLALKVIINIILYVFYVLFVSVVFSFVFPLVMKIFTHEVLDPYNPVFDKIQIFIAILVLIVSLILRKYFYISCKAEEDTLIESYTAKKKLVNTHKTPKTQQKGKKVEKTEEDVKIYVEKEIK